MRRENEHQQNTALKAGVRKRVEQVVFTLLLQAAILFLSSGILAWMWAWVFIALNLAGMAINARIMLRYSPETIAERAKTQGMKSWDKIVAGLWALMYYIVMLLVAGLDRRFSWSGSLALAYHIAGGVFFAAGFALFSWAMVTNAYFSTVARIQEERAHTVCTSGPYRFVRHPGYLGFGLAQMLGTPLMLGSLWSLIPGGLATVLMVIRTALEDRMLQAELDGYQDYAQRVRYRLLPGVW